MQFVKDIVGQKRSKSRVDNPTDPNFFGCDDETIRVHPKKDRNAQRVRDLHPEDFEEFMRMFVCRCDDRAFNRKLGYWRPDTDDGRRMRWQPESKGRLAGEPQYVPAIRKHLTERLERHLAHEQWSKRHRPQHWQQPYVLGLLGGEWSSVFHLDIDNHGGRRIEYHRNGQNLIVPDLSLKFLKYVQNVLSLPFLEAGMPEPCSLNLSSDSLGLYLFFVPELPIKTADGYGRLRELAGRHGLEGLEAFPMPRSSLKGASPHKGRNVHRLPCGHGTAALTADGVITGWREQFVNFYEPKPLPSIHLLAEQLLQRWLELHLRWRPDFLDVDSDRLGHFLDCRDEIRTWVGSGCPVEGEDRPAEKIQVVVPYLVEEKMGTPRHATHEMDGMSHPDRLYEIATAGCLAEGKLNTCIVMLLRHLLQHELDDEDKEQIAFEVLEKWCLAKHNGCSSRLSEEDVILPDDVAAVIRRNIRQLGCDHLRRGRNTLHLRWLITGQGPRNLFSPRHTPHTHDLLSVYTFSGDHQTRADDYQETHRRTIETIGSGIYDHETIETVEHKIRLARPSFQAFARRLTNFLMAKPGQTARIHTQYFMAMAGTTSPTTMTKYKEAAKDEKILKVVSRKYRIGGESMSYQLHPAVLPLRDGRINQTADAVSSMTDG